MVSRSAVLQSGLDMTTREKWVNVTWMPHTSISQTSHVCLTVRSVHASLDDIHHGDEMPLEWKIRVGVFGVGGIALVPIATHTRSSPVLPRRRKLISLEEETNNPLGQDSQKSQPGDKNWRPTVESATHDCCWDQWIQIPIRWRDLPRDAYLFFEVLGKLSDPVVYRGTMPFFSRHGKLSTGLQRVQLKTGPLDPRFNHGLVPLDASAEAKEKQDPVWNASRILDQLKQKQERPQNSVTAFGDIPTIPWLDSLLQKQALEVLSDAPDRPSMTLLDDVAISTASLIIELPSFDIPIMYEETFYPVPQNGASGAVTPLDLVLHKKSVEQGSSGFDPETFDPLHLVTVLEYENENENPVEDKYRTLAHDLIRGLVDPALKPDKKQRDRLAAIIESPSHHPTREEKDLLWRFRFSLVDNRRALTKFLLAVDWSVESEVVQAAELLEQWRKRSPIEVTDALKLLGKHVAFQTNLVRDYAIDTLAAAPDSELRLYLLQLVQALKYENTEAPESSSPTGSLGPPRTPPSPLAPSSHVSALAKFLINRAAKSVQLANFLYWYVFQSACPSVFLIVNLNFYLVGI